MSLSEYIKLEKCHLCKTESQEYSIRLRTGKMCHPITLYPELTRLLTPPHLLLELSCPMEEPNLGLSENKR